MQFGRHVYLSELFHSRSGTPRKKITPPVSSGPYGGPNPPILIISISEESMSHTAKLSELCDGTKVVVQLGPVVSSHLGLRPVCNFVSRALFSHSLC